MSLDRKGRKELVSEIISLLEEVLPASGKPEELVKLTTSIVKNTKLLLKETPEDLATRSTTTLSEFVVAARGIAKNPQSIDASARQALSNSRRAVEAVVKELDSWHDECHRKISEDADVVLKRIASETSLSGSKVGSSGAGTRSAPEQSQEDGKVKQLRQELKKEQISLWKKTEPQQAPVQHGKPVEALTSATGQLQQAIRGLKQAAAMKAPSPVELLEPTLLMAQTVSVLMDLVDSLFVNRYPMRSQVHNFCCTLIESALAFGSQSRAEDTASLRTLASEVPTLLNAAEVMITQCHKRATNMDAQRKLSLQRMSDLHSLDLEGVGGMGKKKQPLPKQPSSAEKGHEEQGGFEIICVLCTNVAVNQQTKKPISKGSEVPLLAYSSTSILDVKRMLCTQTGLPRNNIEIKMQGHDVLPDSTRVKPNNPVPYFVFNIHEPSEDELREMRKKEKLKNKPKLEDLDWSQYTGSVAIALFACDALGDDEGCLNFDEGDVIEIVKKSHDGWWTGRIEETVGDFPASFVEEIEIPRTKQERKQLASRFKRRKSQDKISDSESHDEGRASPLIKNFKKMQSHDPSNGSPNSKKKHDRRVSEPLFSQFDHAAGGGPPARKEKDKKKLGGIFGKKRTTQYMPLPEEPREFPKPRSPILSSDRNKKKTVTVTTSWEEASFRTESPELGKRVISRAAKTVSSSPNLRPRRPPPPVPKSKFPGGSGDTTRELSPSNVDLIALSPDSESEGRVERKHSDLSTDSSKSPEPPQTENTYHFKSTSPVPSFTPSPAAMEEAMGKSESMEELLKNLEEFNVVISSQDGLETPETEDREKDFATIPRSELPVPRKTPGIQVTNEEEMKSKSASNTPEALRRSKPDIAPKPNLQNGFSHSQPEETVRFPSPKAPPRKKKMTQKLKDRADMFESPELETQPPRPGVSTGMKPVRPAPSSPAPPKKPERDEKKRLRARLEVMAERQASSSAPVSRTTSPDIDKLSQEVSSSSEKLFSRSPAPVKRSPLSSNSLSCPPSSLSAAMKCISYLSEEERVADSQLFKVKASSKREVDRQLSTLDKGEEVDVSSMLSTSSVMALLKALLANGRLGPLISYPLSKAMCELVKSASPVSVLGSQLEQLSNGHRSLLKQLLHFFGLVINHSDKNKIEVSDINKFFGGLLFDQLAPVQTEPLLAYLISTRELVIP